MTETTFAEIENGIVKNVIVADQAFVDGLSGLYVQAWIDADGDPAKRANFPNVGDIYDAANDVFYEHRPSNQYGPFNRWTIGAPTWQWTPPVPYPNDGSVYDWDDPEQKWALVVFAA